MAYSDLIKKRVTVSTGKDSIIFQECLTDIPGGRTLDVTNWEEDTIEAGHVIIKTSGGEYTPLGLTEGAYGSIPTGAEVIGLLKTTIEKNDAQAAIVTSGSVNEPALPYELTSNLKTKLKGFQFINE